MKKAVKVIIGLLVALGMVLITVIAAMACTDCNKGGWIEEDLTAAQAVATTPYAPIVMIGGILVLVWIGYQLYKRYA